LDVGDLYQYRDLIRALIVRDLTVRYRRSAIGFLWTMLHPLMMMLVLEVVFSTLFRFTLKDYPVYVFSGILFWNFFSQSVVSSMNSLKGNAALLQKLPVPKAVFPIATVLSGVVNLMFAMVPLMILLLATHHGLCSTFIFLPISIVAATVFTLGIGLLLSPLAVFFSDVVEMVTVFLTVIMYLTPVIYPISIVPARFRPLVELNPLEILLRVFRDPIYACQIPGPASLALAVAVTVLALMLGMAVFQRSAERIPYYL
jgi:ABC-2 type transport system permease protein